MQWLISGKEPDALGKPVLDEEQLSSGIIRELVGLMPWYKKTPRMEVNLASHLAAILRSGLERSYILTQIEKLDIARETAEKFMTILIDRGVCNFAKPRYYYNAALHAVDYQNGMLVLNKYLRSKVFVTRALYECLMLLDTPMERKRFHTKLEEYLGSEELVQKVCSTLAQQGLLLSCDSAQIPVSDHGPLRWNVEISARGELLDNTQWEKRLEFLRESFDLFYFQSNELYYHTPVRLCADFEVITSKGSPDYFLDLSFKLQAMCELVPVDLRLSMPAPEDGWQDFQTQSPPIFNWAFTADLRQDSARAVEGLIKFANHHPLLPDQTITLLTDSPLPTELASLNDRARLKLYYANCSELAVNPCARDLTVAVNCRPLLSFFYREGCSPTLSPYIDGEGKVYTCSLEGGICLGHIDSGAKAIEAERRRLRAGHEGACHFGVNPGTVGNRNALDRSAQAWRDEMVTELTADFTCP